MTSSDDDLNSPTLSDKIAEWSAEHASDFPPEIQAIFARKTEELLRSGILAQCIGQNDVAPDFALSKPDGSEVRLSDRLEKGPAILSFYRGTWCPYCNLEFQELLHTLPQYRSRGAMILALSPQINDRFAPVAEAGFEDLSDQGNQVARSYGLVHPIGAELQKIYQGFGIRLDDLNGDTSYELPIPATYVVDQDAKIRYAYASVNPADRAEPGELVSILSNL